MTPVAERSGQHTTTPAMLLAIMMAAGLAIFDPIGWDHFGPIRWLIIPALGFWAVALVGVDRLPALLRQRRSPVAICTMLFGGLLAWGVVATILAADPLHAWIGTPDRRFGWLIWLLCAGLFVTAATGSIDRVVILRGAVIGAVAMGLICLFELGGIRIGPSFAGSRLGGPFGQPAYLGAAAALVTPVAAGLVFDRSWPPIWRALAVVGTVGGSVALIGSQSRAAWLGVTGAGAVALAVFIIGNRDHGRGRGRMGGNDADGRPTSAATKKPAWFLPVAVPVMAPVMVPVIVPVIVIVAVPRLRERLTSAGSDGGVIDGRLDEWRVGLRALGHSPIVGYGPEGYRTVFGVNVDEQYVIDWGREVITDRAHSAVIDVSLAFGVIGGLAYLALLATVAVAAVKAIGGDPVRTGLAVGVLAYLVQQLFLFPLSEVDPLLWVIVGLLLTWQRRESEPDPGRDRSGSATAVCNGLLMGLAVVVTVAGGLDLGANAIVASAVEEDETTEGGDADVAGALRLRPDSTRLLFIASRLDRQRGDLTAALAHIDDGLARSPADPAFTGERARLLLDQARATSGTSAGPANLDAALEALEALVADDPNHPLHLQRLGIAQALNGDLEAAATTLERAVRLAPNQAEPQANLAEVRRLQDAE